MHPSAFRPAFLALAVAAAVSTPAAFATATGTASINVVSWTLIDLNTSDGITPFFLTTTGGSSSSVRLANSNNSFYQFAPGVYQPTSATDSNAYGSGTASTSSTGGSATVSSYGSSIAGAGQYNYASVEPFDVNFVLSPNTLVIVNAAFTLSASTTLGLSPNSFYESAQSYAYITGSILDPVTGNYSATNSTTRSTYASYTYNNNTQTYTGQSRTNNGALQLIFANQTSSLVTGFVSAYTDVQASSSYLAAVPENDTLSLMAAGLLVTGALVRRRQRRG